MAIKPDDEARGFEFQFSDHEGDKLASAVYQALGYASMCWTAPPQGEFDSARCKDAAEKLLAFIDEQQQLEADEEVDG